MSDDTTTPPAAPPAPAPVAEPTFSADYVKQLRDEAAASRIAKNEAVEAGKAAVEAAKAASQQEWSGKVSSLESDLGDSWVYAAKLHAAIEAGVQPEKILGFANLLKGVDEASIKSSAEAAKQLFGITSVPATDPTQGSGTSGHLPLNGDPLLNVLKNVVGAK